MRFSVQRQTPNSTHIPKLIFTSHLSLSNISQIAAIMELYPTPDSFSEPNILSLPQLTDPTQMKKKRKKKKKSKYQQPSSSSSSSSARKRNQCPGVRIRGGRIFDSENGKTCHQCRQKTMDIIAVCKSQIDEKLCNIKFCLKCLLNRYGEKVEEANMLDDWKCPKCRGICNCSFCMKKRGHQPTGILVHAAKKTGFQSVLEMLNVNGPENVCVVRRKGIRKKIKEHSMKDGNSRSKKRAKITRLMSEIDLNVMVNEDETISEMMGGVEKTPKVRQNKLRKLAWGRRFNVRDNGAQSENYMEESRLHKRTAFYRMKTQEKVADSKDSHICIYAEKLIELIKKEETDRKHMLLPARGTNDGNYIIGRKPTPTTSYQLKRESDADNSLSCRINLTTAADIDLPAEDVLQFLEFCNAFGKELLSKEVPDTQVLKPTPGVPLQVMASCSNFVHSIS